MEVLQVKTAEEVPRSELKVIASLKAAKRDSATALHSIAWQGTRLERQSDGEADVVIIDMRHGILVLEVKGGGIDVQDGAWYTTDRTGQRHQIKNPFEQAKASKHALIRYLRSTEPDIARKIGIVHAVVFPDVTCDLRWLGPDSPRAIVIDRADLSDINEALTRIFAHWQVRCSISLEDQARLRAQLSPTVSIKRKLSDLVSETEHDLYRLTQEQIRAIESLRRNRRLLVLGGAGTGKTILAVERARQLSKGGNSTLLLCFNRPLADHLERWLEDSEVTVETFHSLCTRHFDQAGVPYPPPHQADWWNNDAAAIFLERCAAECKKYDAILVDEAQDFSEDWLEMVECLLSSRQDAVFVLYGDMHQTLWHRGWDRWLKRHEWPQYELVTNCRNSLPIAKKVAAVFGDPVQSLGAQGPDPAFHQLDLRREGIVPVISLIMRALEGDDLKPGQIAVLTSTRELADRFQSTMVWEHQFSPAGKANVMVADTVHRFKGLEAAFVVVVLGPEVGDGSGDDFRELKYVAYSRPTAALHVFVPKGFRR